MTTQVLLDAVRRYVKALDAEKIALAAAVAARDPEHDIGKRAELIEAEKALRIAAFEEETLNTTH